MFVHVAELDVVLLGAGVSDGTTTFTSLLESEPPASVILTPGAENGTDPRVWKRPGIVKLVFVPKVCGPMTRPLSVVLEVPAYRSRLLVIEILLTVTEAELRNDMLGMAASAGSIPKSSWKNWVFRLFTCASRSLT